MLEKKTRKTKPPPVAREAALRLLSRREHSTRELKRKLSARGVDHVEASAAIDALASRDLQSDTRYAAQLLRTRITQGHGPRRIRAELGMAGLARDAIEQAMQQAECDWFELAQRVLQRRFKINANTPAMKRKQQQFLYTRGFEAGQIERALGRTEES